MMGGAKAGYDGIVAFSQTDFTEDLKKISVPVLVMHSEDDQIVPYADAGPLSAKLLKNGTLKTYKGFPHGMPTTQADTINADLLAFIKSRLNERHCHEDAGIGNKLVEFRNMLVSIRGKVSLRRVVRLQV
jgi:dienelactone hydrolase